MSIPSDSRSKWKKCFKLKMYRSYPLIFLVFEMFIFLERHKSVLDWILKISYPYYTLLVYMFGNVKFIRNKKQKKNVKKNG